METFAAKTEFKSLLSRPSALTRPPLSPKLHLAGGKTTPVSFLPSTQGSTNLLSQLAIAQERTRVLQKALMLEVKHHMDELLEFEDNDPFFNVFMEYHTQRIYSLQKALTAAFPDSCEDNGAT